jgi:uncharacterized protein
MRRLSNDQARRIALGAQGFTDPRPTGRVDRRHFRRVIDRIGLLQLDSVNVLERSHYLPMWSRLGAYSKDALDDFTARSGELFEYWGHEASLLPARTQRLFRWRMDEWQPGRRLQSVLEADPSYVEAVLEEITTRGPLSTSELSDPGDRRGPWWGHGKGKTALDWLFAKGRVTAYRKGNFGRLYDLPQRVIPSEHLEAPAPPKDQALRELLLLAARHHGIGTARDLADYYRLNKPTSRAVLTQLVASGELEQVEVAGWREAAYKHPAAKLPRKITGAALLSPFDPVVWERSRAERIFGFHYRIEIYVPEPKRVYGYYVLPFLLDGELVGRVDLKADRKQGALLVRGSYVEEGRSAAAVAARLAPELRDMSEWLGLAELRLAKRGNLSAALRKLI